MFIQLDIDGIQDVPETHIVIGIMFIGCDNVTEIHHKFVVVLKGHLCARCKACKAYADEVSGYSMKVDNGRRHEPNNWVCRDTHSRQLRVQLITQSNCFKYG